ncbi:MAG: hypothetical protein HOV82_16865 [Streptomyces sp.]|nr:hypothetical protein [Streptomyces sp.]NUP36153.1 hypothetical protein [Streptomyces sp.]NUS75500.1 hypothetical protein [Streptomyces sp.]
MSLTAAAALAVMTVLAGLTVLARTLPARPRTATASAELLRPIEALDQVEAHCPYERRTTLHVRFAMGGTQCLECRAHLTTTKEVKP